MILFHLFVYWDEREGGSIHDFKGAYDSLEEAESKIPYQDENLDYAYIASFDDSTRQWEAYDWYIRTDHPIINGELQWGLYTEKRRWVKSTDYRQWYEITS